MIRYCILRDGLKALNADVKFTGRKGLAHFICDKAYQETELPAWLFAQLLNTAQEL